MEVDGHEYLSVKEFCERYSWFTENQMRGLLNNRRKNGLDSATYRISSKKVLVRVDRFLEWFESRREG